MGRELETKFAATPQTLERVAHDVGETEEIKMVTRYFDTPSGALGARKWTLRVRTENGTPVCTLKTPRADGARGEWETPCADPCAAVPALIGLGAPAELADVVSEGLRQICGARFTRRCKRLNCGGAELELALDEGILIGKSCKAPLCEIELELKTGKDAALYAASAALERKYGLKRETKSKFSRARAL